MKARSHARARRSSRAWSCAAMRSSCTAWIKNKSACLAPFYGRRQRHSIHTAIRNLDVDIPIYLFDAPGRRVLGWRRLLRLSLSTTGRAPFDGALFLFSDPGNCPHRDRHLRQFAAEMAALLFRDCGGVGVGERDHSHRYRAASWRLWTRPALLHLDLDSAGADHAVPVVR